MSIMIANYKFEGPFRSLDQIKNKSGVYAIILHTSENLYLLDLGQGENIKNKIENHERKDQWKKYSSQGNLEYGLCYADNKDEKDRLAMVSEINKVYKTPFINE